MAQHFDVIVVGCGAVGSAALDALAKQGHRVLGLDQYTPPHSYGSSHGETRIIRKAYFEHSAYVPLLHRAYQAWHELEQATDKQLFHRTGLIEVGPADGVVIPGVLRSAALHDLPIEHLTQSEFACRYPGMRCSEDSEIILEQDAGYLRVEACIQHFLEQSVVHGATLKLNQMVLEWRSQGNLLSLITDQATYQTERVVLTAGPWAPRWLAASGIPLRVLRKHLYWYECEAGIYHERQGFPCFFFETPTGYFYGFPQRDDLGLKVARHSGGTAVDGPIKEDAQTDDQDLVAVSDFLNQHLPQVGSVPKQTKCCYYTMTPDENFIVDTLPDDPRIVIAAGLSGHGFKFASVLGEVVAKLALGQPPGFDIEFLRCARFLQNQRPSGPRRLDR